MHARAHEHRAPPPNAHTEPHRVHAHTEPHRHRRTHAQSPTAYTRTDPQQDPPSSRFLLNTAARLKSHVGSCYRRFTQGQSLTEVCPAPCGLHHSPLPWLFSPAALLSPPPSPHSSTFLPSVPPAPSPTFSPPPRILQPLTLCLPWSPECMPDEQKAPCPLPQPWHLGALSKCLLKG